MQEGFGLYADDFVKDLEVLAGRELRERREPESG
jgi:hypothetical protein